MAKVDTELVKLVLQRNNLDVRQVASIMEEIQEEVQVQQEQAAAERPPPVKKQFVILASDPTGELEGKDLTAWVLQIPEESSPREAERKLIQAAYDYNISPKGRRIPVKTIGEACEVISAKFFKEHAVWVKTKEPIWVVRTGNEIPREEMQKLKAVQDA